MIGINKLGRLAAPSYQGASGATGGTMSKGVSQGTPPCGGMSIDFGLAGVLALKAALNNKWEQLRGQLVDPQAWQGRCYRNQATFSNVVELC